MKDATPEQQKLGFRIHAISFVAGIIILAIVNYFTGVYPWILWVLLGWSIGLLCHWFFVLGPGAGSSKTGAA